jgi:hypothetical protein
MLTSLNEILTASLTELRTTVKPEGVVRNWAKVRDGLRASKSSDIRDCIFVLMCRCYELIQCRWTTTVVLMRLDSWVPRAREAQALYL